MSGSEREILSSKELSMNNEQIKQLLLSIEDCQYDFSVTMTGKSSPKVNGLYKPESHEIFLHNKNFKNDNALIYTAIHEYTHHLLTAEAEKSGIRTTSRTKVHDTKFWAKMDGLVEKAVEKGVYKRIRSEKLSGLIEEAKQIDHEIASLKKKLGTILQKIHQVSDEEGTRFEDVLAHDIRMQKSTAEKCFNASLVDQDNIGQDVQEVLSKTVKKSGAVKEAAKNAVSENKTVEQLKMEIQLQSDKSRESSPKQKLEKEKNRLEKTISALQQRLSIVCETIESM